MKKVDIGEKSLEAISLATPTSALLAIRAPKGLLGCGYLNVETADKLGEALAIVTGVATPEEMLEKKVVRLSSAAKALGISTEDTGKSALLKML